MKFYLVILSLISFQIMAQTTLEWQFFHPKKEVWMAAGTHGSVQEKLIETGELPDPFYGKNESLFAWIEKYNWGFKTEFKLTEEQLQKDYVELEFPGIDTYAEIFVNDSLIAFAQNAFRPYYFDVKNNLKLGQNTIKVKFYSPVNYHKAAYTTASYHLPAPNDVDPIAIAPYTRKPQYQFGWDWALRMNTMGFLKPVKLNTYNAAKISLTSIITASVEEEKADLNLSLYFSQPSKGTLIWKSKLFGEVEIDENSIKVDRLESIENPKLWWPRGQGEQNLYTDEWQIVNEKGEVIDSRTVRFGIKTSEIVMEADEWGTSHVVKVNGRPIFCKGGDYIPQDIFPARVTDADLRRMVDVMARSNFNMVRVWGGGYYPDEAFFDACDEQGIMVWEDFMFACAMYPGDPDFLLNVKEEIDYQIPRIASHASLTLFNGNNEVDVAWKNWGFQVKYNLYGKDAKEIEDSYNRLFKQLIPTQVSALSSAPYSHTSPLSNWGKDEFYNHGTQHYWGVWHGKDPMEDFAKKIGRFNAEYGFQSFPEYSTLSTFSEKTDWDLESDIMKHHQKSYVGNGMILKHAKILFGTPANFEEFVYYSQLTEATAVSMAVTGHRLDVPRCSGTLYWQINDCWPAPSWSSMDYFWNWKALQYEVTKDYEDIAVLRKSTGKNIYEYYLLSDQVDTVLTELKFTVFDLKGKQLESVSTKLIVNGVQKQLIDFSCIRQFHANQNIVVRLDWKNAAGEVKTRTFSELPIAYTKAQTNDLKIELRDIDPVAKTATLIFKNKSYVRACWIYSSKLGVQFETNFEDYLPGEHAIQIHFDELPTEEDFAVKFM